MVELTIIGHIGQDAVVRTVNGKSFISFSVASSETFKNQSGEVTEKTTWVNFTRTHNPDSKLVEYLKKGTMVYVKGSVNLSPYSDSLGKPSASLNSHVKEIKLLGGSKKENVVGEAVPPAPANQTPAPTPVDDDLPF